MRKIRFVTLTSVSVLGAMILLVGCSNKKAVPVPSPETTAQAVYSANLPTNDSSTAKQGSTQEEKQGGADHQIVHLENGVEIAAKPDDIAVLVNKQVKLPDDYNPPDLVEPKIPFIFTEKDDRRLMRKVAAEALEKLVADAKNEGIHLAGVSGYRSYQTQKTLFNYYISVQGQELARKYSAEPGHSEHETGLAMDLSDTKGTCAAEDCFANTPEAKWLADHAADYGFIIRYPKGKESITGYNYEPWHIRYVGTQLAKELTSKGLTLEEYYDHKAMVSN
ncbi:M15 family metallopeptidase [Effusibacillus dendaii]|uniref:Putative carboxypeptidase YodJ n=1 Tax=Effusibacillus dendaii TaxID=2743772 RepID=A0A7I8DHE9_9BACL|nr:M15 family metallopeptidase [Effusibacillus dendaii]BCJ88336.1 putative carboxypeptidase YodJ [Effusibacillus dendaii]